MYLFDSVKTQNALTKYLPVLSSVSSLQLMHLCSSKHYITYLLFLSSAMAQYSFSVMTDFVFCFVFLTWLKCKKYLTNHLMFTVENEKPCASSKFLKTAVDY